MNLRIALALILFSTFTFSPLRAEIVPMDDLFRAMDQAGISLAKGGDRAAIAAGLVQEIKSNPQSSYVARAQRMADSIQKAAEQSRDLPDGEKALRQTPERFLIETAFPVGLVMLRSNQRPMEKYLAERPTDPFVLLLARGRSAIPAMLPLLNDRSATRYYQPIRLNGAVPDVVCVCDYALALIEHVSLCRFHFTAVSFQYFHSLPDDQRAQTIAHIKQWWRENSDKSLGEGIRAQLPNGAFYAQVEMAENLIELGRRNDSDDDEFGLDTLRQLFKTHHGHTAAHVAKSLAKYRDLSPVDVFYQRWKEGLDRPGIIYDSSVTFYLTDHGGRREWELLHEISKREIDRGIGPGVAGVWPQVINSSKAASSPWSVPVLGLVVTEADPTQRKWIGDEISPSSDTYAERAVALLQRHTGQDFGYRIGNPVEEKLDVLRKAQAWWREVGAKEYTFDRIEERLQAKNK